MGLIVRYLFRKYRGLEKEGASEKAPGAKLMAEYGSPVICTQNQREKEPRLARRGCSKEELAERVGFEPTVRFPAHTLSKRAP